MIYIYTTQTGVDSHTDKEFAENTLNLGEPLATLTEQEWSKCEGMARLIDGTLFLGKTQAEKDREQADAVRAERDRLIAKEDWRYTRYNSEVRQGLTPSDDIVTLDAYIQALRDIPDQAGFPWDVEWPTL